MTSTYLSRRQLCISHRRVEMPRKSPSLDYVTADSRSAIINIYPTAERTYRNIRRCSLHLKVSGRRKLNRRGWILTHFWVCFAAGKVTTGQAKSKSMVCEILQADYLQKPGSSPAQLLYRASGFFKMRGFYYCYITVTPTRRPSSHAPDSQSCRQHCSDVSGVLFRAVGA